MLALLTILVATLGATLTTYSLESLPADHAARRRSSARTYVLRTGRLRRGNGVGHSDSQRWGDRHCSREPDAASSATWNSGGVHRRLQRGRAPGPSRADGSQARRGRRITCCSWSFLRCSFPCSRAPFMAPPTELHGRLESIDSTCPFTSASSRGSSRAESSAAAPGIRRRPAHLPVPRRFRGRATGPCRPGPVSSRCGPEHRVDNRGGRAAPSMGIDPYR